MEVINIRALPQGTFTWKPYWMGQGTAFRKQFTLFFLDQLMHHTKFTFWNCNCLDDGTKGQLQRDHERLEWALENRIFCGPTDSSQAATTYYDPLQLTSLQQDEHQIHAQFVIDGGELMQDLRQKHTTAWCTPQKYFTLDKYVNSNEAECSCFMYGTMAIMFPDVSRLSYREHKVAKMYYAWRYTSPKENAAAGNGGTSQDSIPSGLNQVIASNSLPSGSSVIWPAPLLNLNGTLETGESMYRAVEATFGSVWGEMSENFILGTGLNPGMMLSDWRAQLQRSIDHPMVSPQHAGPPFAYVNPKDLHYT